MLPRRDAYILVVDDEPAMRELLSSQMSYLGHACRQAGDAKEALQVVREHPRPGLVLSDVHLAGSSGVDLLHQLKELDEDIQVVMITGLEDIETVRSCLREGAYDYLTKPVDLDHLTNVVSRALDRHQLLHENERYRADLERMVREQTEEIRQTRDIALITLARLAESRDSETGIHLERMAGFSRRIAEQLRQDGLAEEVDSGFIEHLFKSSPLHDIGKVGIPDQILLKAGPLDPAEAEIMQAHTTIGGDTLRSVIEQYETHSFLVMAMEIAYSHHERWDGEGYPKGLAGQDIPLAARIVALADAYDAITSDRPYKLAVDHTEAVRRISIDSGKHFDPVVVDAFLACEADFPDIRARPTSHGGNASRSITEAPGQKSGSGAQAG